MTVDHQYLTFVRLCDDGTQSVDFVMSAYGDNVVRKEFLYKFVVYFAFVLMKMFSNKVIPSESRWLGRFNLFRDGC